MAQNRRRDIWHYRPGEMVVASELSDAATDHRQAHRAVRQAIEQHLAGTVGGVFHASQRRSEPIVFRARGRPPLAFFFYDLAQPAHDFVKQVVYHVHANQLAALQPVRGAGISPLGVMPHWLGSAQQEYSDGSPATFPRPIRPPSTGRWRYRYTARDKALDFRGRLGRIPAGAHVPVVVLDTRPDLARARRQAARFGDSNAQLGEVVDLLAGAALPDWHAAALDERDTEGVKLARSPDGRAHAHDVSEHSLFISGLIHDQAARADVRVRPVLNRFGVGDLHLLLLVLHDVLNGKPVEAPLVINMSLGFVPKLEQLPWLFFGVEPPNEPDFVRDVAIRGEPRDQAWLVRNHQQVDESTHLLHGGLGRLAEYLLANNCLAVAAAGNDSLSRVQTGRPRLGPRIPARYESVLGVAATVRDPSNAAPYSNAGDELEFGDHIATFGGDVAEGGEPKDGVVGVYAAPTFPPPGRTPNDTGWATWSGTSFATGIASGLVAGFWTTQLNRQPNMRAEDVLAGFNTLAGNYAPAVRTPSIAVTGDWKPG